MPRRYLPSAQFVLLTGSLFLSAGLIYAAQMYTKSAYKSATLTAASGQNAEQRDWERMLEDIQAQDPSYSLPEPPSEESISALLDAAQSTNLTDTIGRTLLINLTAAKSQGLGDDIPTQEQLIAQAAAQLPPTAGTKSYTAADLIVAPAGEEGVHAYGNAVITALVAHPDTEPQKTMVTIGMATDSGDASYLNGLSAIKQEYDGLAADLREIPVPQTLVPLHLQLINNFAYAASLYANMGTVFTDPLRALSTLQMYQAKSDEIGRVFTTIAQQMSYDGILFTKDEPGNAWNALLSVQ
ncbi:MAG: hypothetical protein AAB449_01080 [Patescibacteria group bacterium]